ncbi:hypothetical protein BBJ29_006980 [Phytophthora kernoviae]|uniref:Lipid-binding serum glycoprotein N-terminal domain-containing protein n=1 Tax=Phytophthora kernoviae TaxID=325452 RepID=A0A3F2S1E2_9STRA|nr:hypothetical protein BBJ29_006980 [Phytophthora kernoviae]RLN68345.1 hypothetical protein BBP00_00001112 [Phytophthora kernoviae]
MSKVAALVTTATLAALAFTRAAAMDSCVLVDFTAEASEFADLNAAIDLAMSADVIGSMLAKYDPLILKDITLANFEFDLLGQSVTIVPTIDLLNITGLTTLAPQHINVTSSSCIDIGAYSDGEVSIDATLSVTIKELEVSTSAHAKIGLKKPTLKTIVEANVYTCAPGVLTSQCSNMTVMDFETQVIGATVSKNYDSILENVLRRVKDSSVKSFTLDFEKVCAFDISFDSASLVFSSISSLLERFSVAEINKKDEACSYKVQGILEGGVSYNAGIRDHDLVNGYCEYSKLAIKDQKLRWKDDTLGKLNALEPGTVFIVFVKRRLQLATVEQDHWKKRTTTIARQKRDSNWQDSKESW